MMLPSLTSEHIERVMVGTKRMHQRYVRKDSRGQPDGFDQLSELVMGEGESDGVQYQSETANGVQVGHLWGRMV